MSELVQEDFTKEDELFADELIQNPFDYIKYFLGVEALTDGQRVVVQSVWDNKYTAVTSSPGIGKSFIAACILLWFLNSRPNCKVVSTAPSARQVEDILWSEISQLYKNLPNPLGKKLQTNIIVAPEWFATGVTTTAGQEDEVAEKIKGYHAPGGVLVVLDEATAIHQAVWESLKTTVSGDNCKVLAIGNPSTNNCEFKNFCDKATTTVIVLSALEHPNIVNKTNVIRGAIDINWVKEVIADHCKVVDEMSVQRNTFRFEGKIYMPDPTGTWQLLGKFPLEASSRFLYMLNKEIHGSFAMPEYKSDIMAFIDYGGICVGAFGVVDNQGVKYGLNEWYEDDPLHELRDRAVSFSNFCIDKGYHDFTCYCDTDMFNEPSKLYSAGRQQAPVEMFKRICRDLNIRFVKVIKKGNDDVKTYRKYCNTIMRDGLNYRIDSEGYFIKPPSIFIDSEKCSMFWKTAPLLKPSKLEPEWDYDQSDTRVDDHCYEAWKGLMAMMRKPILLTDEDRRKMAEELHERAERTPF